MFPTPKNLKIKKSVKKAPEINPFFEFAKSVEKVKVRAKKTITKNRGITPCVLGSTA